MLAVLLVTGTACSKKFLEFDPQQNTEVSKSIIDVPGMRAAVNGVYSILQGSNAYGRSIMLIPDLMSDNVQISVVNANRYQPEAQYNVSSNETFVNGLWNSLYAAVANANLIIQKGDTLSVPVADTAEKRRLLGHAYALRSLAYFNLVRFFSHPYNYTADASHRGVPISLITGTEKSSAVSLPRSSVKDTYDQIVKDLDSALVKLTYDTSVTTRTRMTYYGAQALLSRVYLYRGDYAKVIDLSTKIIDKKKYTLLPRSTFVADFKKQNNGESILEIGNTPTDNLTTDALAYFYSQSGYGDAFATDTMNKIYKSTDIRKDFMTRRSRAGTGGEPSVNIVTKYSNVTTYEENIKVLRLAEIYLNRAEAYANLNQEDLARSDLNVIIARADTDASSQVGAGVTGDDLKIAILNERRKEFAFEGHRLFDLTRLKQSFIKTLIGGAQLIIAAPENRTILPIPQREMDANPKLAGQQNLGY